MRIAYMETWLSGRKHLTANETGSKSPRGFESLRLRIIGIDSILEEFKLFDLKHQSTKKAPKGEFFSESKIP